MDFSDEEVQEFKIEASELLNEAEDSLLQVEKGADFKRHYDSIFRAFHSLKGAAGMLEITELQNHMHIIENHFQQFINSTAISPPQITYFLSAIDASRSLLENRPVNFSYTLPNGEETTARTEKAAETSKNAPQEASTEIEQITSKGQKELIVVIDDEPDLVEIIGGMLEKYSYNWKGYTDPMKAMAEMEDLDPALILTDMNMPKLNGIQVLNMAKSINTDIPVIIISAHLSKEVLIEAISSGVYGVLEKPSKEPQVISLVHLALKQNKMWQLLNRSIDMILFQFQDIDKFLKSMGKQDIAQILKMDVEALLKAKREIKGHKTL